MKNFKDLTLGELCNYCQTRDEKTCNPTNCKYFNICDKIQGALPYEWFEKEELTEPKTLKEANEELNNLIDREILSLLDSVSDKCNLDVKREIADDKVLNGAKDLIKGYLEQVERDKKKIRENQPLTLDELKEELSKANALVDNKLYKHKELRLRISYDDTQDKYLYFITYLRAL